MPSPVMEVHCHRPLWCLQTAMAHKGFGSLLGTCAVLMRASVALLTHAVPMTILEKHTSALKCTCLFNDRAILTRVACRLSSGCPPFAASSTSPTSSSRYVPPSRAHCNNGLIIYCNRARPVSALSSTRRPPLPLPSLKCPRRMSPPLPSLSRPSRPTSTTATTRSASSGVEVSCPSAPSLVLPSSRRPRPRSSLPATPKPLVVPCASQTRVVCELLLVVLNYVAEGVNKYLQER